MNVLIVSHLASVKRKECTLIHTIQDSLGPNNNNESGESVQSHNFVLFAMNRSPLIGSKSGLPK